MNVDHFCTNRGCPNYGRPFTFTTIEVAEAGGYINCDRCGRKMLLSMKIKVQINAEQMGRIAVKYPTCITTLDFKVVDVPGGGQALDFIVSTTTAAMESVFGRDVAQGMIYRAL